MIPTTLGNIIGGGLFVGAAYWYLYLTGEGAVDIDFNIGGLNSAMEAGGPMGPIGLKHQPMPNGHRDSEPEVIEGKAVEGVDTQASSDSSAQLPHSGSYMTSGIGKELDPNIYAKSKMQRMDEEKATG